MKQQTMSVVLDEDPETIGDNPNLKEILEEMFGGWFLSPLAEGLTPDERERMWCTYQRIKKLCGDE